jgi:UDP-glucose 4-epimerase
MPDARPTLVTGGAGAIGWVLVDSLVRSGASVVVLDNLSSGKRENLARGEGSARARVEVVDLLDAEKIRPHFRGAGAVWHLAANPDIRRGTDEPRLDLEQGTIATFNVLEAARRADVPELFFSSSSVVYGFPRTFPTPEEYGPLLPQSLYGASKLASEALLSAYAECYGLRAAIFRFANIVGPGMTHGVIYDFFQKLEKDPSRLEVLGDGRQAKSYLRVEDCVAGMRLAAERAKEKVSVFNLGTHDRISVKEIAERVVRAHGGRARVEYTGGERGWPGDIPQQLLAIDRITGLGWSPRWNSSEAVDRTIEEMSAGLRRSAG